VHEIQEDLARAVGVSRSLNREPALDVVLDRDLADLHAGGRLRSGDVGVLADIAAKRDTAVTRRTNLDRFPVIRVRGYETRPARSSSRPHPPPSYQPVAAAMSFVPAPVSWWSYRKSTARGYPPAAVAAVVDRM
jgi:hypothetical protein